MHVLSSAHIPRLLKIIRATLFPNNAPGPPRKIPNADEVAAIKRKCAETIVAMVPKPMIARYLGNEGVEEIEDMLGVLGDAYLNKHLIYNLIELLLVRLLPELAEHSVGELMKERLGEEKNL
jgi:hypothetical protein